MSDPLRNTSRRAAFFCYHSVASQGPPFLTISPEDFEHQLATLRRHGWASGSERSLEQLARGGPATRQPTAFLTFDDGYVDNYTHVFPLLREHGFTAFVFIIPPLVDAAAPLRWDGTEASCDRFPDVMRSMTWEMVETMAEGGIVFGGHTNTHRRLTQLGPEELREELLDSRRQIVARLGSCDSLAYPYGDENAEVRAAARDAGYRWAFTIPRSGQRIVEPLAIPRIAVDHRDGGRRFDLKLQAVGRRAVLSPLRPPVRRGLDRAVSLTRRATGSRRGSAASRADAP